MKLNYETCLVGERVILVPYRKSVTSKDLSDDANQFSLTSSCARPIYFDENAIIPVVDRSIL